MTDNDIIDEVVRQVMEQLHASRGTCAGPANSNPPPRAQRRVFDQPVITYEVLEQQLNGARQIEVGSKSVLTPSARDLLRTRKIDWQRSVQQTSSQNSTAVWQACSVDAAEPAHAVVNDLQASGAITVCSEQFADLGAAVGRSVETLRNQPATGVVVMTRNPEFAACLANRHCHVRAAVVQSRGDAERIQRRLGANLICVDGRGHSFFELRNVLTAILSGPAPTVPPDWPS